MLSLFTRVCHEEGIRNPEKLFDDLRHEYNCQSRRYHNFYHVHDVMERIEELLPEQEGKDIDLNALIMAVFYHDIVCLPGWNQNEGVSANWAVHVLRLHGASRELIYDVW